MTAVSTWVRPVLLVLAGGLAGCIIGTWPQPPDSEMDPTGVDNSNSGGGQNDNSSVAGELCDGLDDEGDGVIDEGCPCATDEDRGCVVSDEGRCFEGVQSCVNDRWSDCESLTDTGPAVSEEVVVDVSVAQLTANGAETFTVTARPRAACPGIAPSVVRIEVRSERPSLTLNVDAVDDGSGDDPVAGDGDYTVRLTNPFGPGVGEQSLVVRAVVILERREVIGEAVVELEVLP